MKFPMGQFQDAPEQRWREELRRYFQNIEDGITGPAGERGAKGDKGDAGSNGELPFILIPWTAGTDLQLTPDQFPAIIQVVWSAVPAGIDQVILPEPAQGMYGDLFITYPRGAWVAPNVYELADESGTALFTMGTAPGVGVVTNWFKLTVCEPVVGTPTWAWVLEKAAF